MSFISDFHLALQNFNSEWANIKVGIEAERAIIDVLKKQRDGVQAEYDRLKADLESLSSLKGSIEAQLIKLREEASVVKATAENEAKALLAKASAELTIAEGKKAEFFEKLKQVGEKLERASHLEGAWKEKFETLKKLA